MRSIRPSLAGRRCRYTRGPPHKLRRRIRSVLPRIRQTSRHAATASDTVEHPSPDCPVGLPETASAEVDDATKAADWGTEVQLPSLAPRRQCAWDGRRLYLAPASRRLRGRRYVCRRLDPLPLASAPGCRSPGGAATLADAHLAARPDESQTLAGVLGALPLGRRSGHPPAIRLTVPSGLQ